MKHLVSKVYYGGKFLYEVRHPLSVQDPKEAILDVRNKIFIVVITEEV